MANELLADWETSFVADRENVRVNQSSGVHFLRKETRCRELQNGGAEGTKGAMRTVASSYFGPKLFPVPARIVTMPGFYWNMERGLIKQRLQQGLDTFLVCLERDEALYRAAIMNIPGGENGFRFKECPDWATAVIATNRIVFYRCEFNDLSFGKKNSITGAWLDFCGPIGSNRMNALVEFWDRLKPLRMILTGMVGRQDAKAHEQIVSCGGHAGWVEKSFAMSRVIDYRTYKDGALMFQAVIDNFNGRWRRPDEMEVVLPRPNQTRCPVINYGQFNKIRTLDR